MTHHSLACLQSSTEERPRGHANARPLTSGELTQETLLHTAATYERMVRAAEEMEKTRVPDRSLPRAGRGITDVMPPGSPSLKWVASLSLFTFVVTVDNIIDYDANFAFVRHVLSMDTTFPDDTLRWRAITEPTFWHVFYALIIFGEGMTCLAFALAASQMAHALRSSPPIFDAAKRHVHTGALIGFIVWFTRVHGDWRGVVCDVAIADLERPASSISFLCNATSSAHLRRPA